MGMGMVAVAVAVMEVYLLLLLLLLVLVLFLLELSQLLGVAGVAGVVVGLGARVRGGGGAVGAHFGWSLTMWFLSGVGMVLHCLC